VRILQAVSFWAFVISLSLFAADALAQKRVALVIGNSNYVNVRALPNPQSDATAMAALFRAAGFDIVDASNNLGGTEMRRVFRDFAEKSRSADIAVVFYAGHGIEIDGTNYLLPVDTSLKRDLDVEDEALSLDRVLRLLESAKRLRLIILDACRDNPFVRTVQRTSETRSIGRGLARIEPPSTDTLIAFAAKAGSTAADGDGMHSPFTTALLKNLTVPGLDLRIALGRVRDEVMSGTGRKQEPFVYGTLGGTTVSLLPEPKPVAAAAPAAGPAPNADVRLDYDRAAQVGTKESWDAFLAIHGSGFYADLARAQRAKLAATTETMEKSATPPTSNPAPASPPTSPPGPVLSSVMPRTPEETTKAANPLDAARLMHAELQRLGCYSGAIETPWGSNSRRALELFNKSTGQKLDTRFASLDTLDVLRGNPNRVCPLHCNSGYSVENDTCVKFVCGTGFVARANGKCDPRSQSKTASRPDPREAKQAAPRKPAGGAAPARVVCGMNGCLNVSTGCRSEMRAAGNGEVAVVICDKK
jgi:uncharacterized caspase-like protein